MNILPLKSPLRTQKRYVMLGILLTHLGVSHAFLPPGDGGGGGGGEGGGGGGSVTPLAKCLASSAISLNATPATIVSFR